MHMLAAQTTLPFWRKKSARLRELRAQRRPVLTFPASNVGDSL